MKLLMVFVKQCMTYLWCRHSLLFLLFLLLSSHPLQSVKSNVKGPFEVKTWRAPPAAAVPLSSAATMSMTFLWLTAAWLSFIQTDQRWPLETGRCRWTAGKKKHRYSLWTCIFRLVLKHHQTKMTFTGAQFTNMRILDSLREFKIIFFDSVCTTKAYFKN